MCFQPKQSQGNFRTRKETFSDSLCRGRVHEELDITLVFSCPHHELFNESLKSIYYKNITRVQFVPIFAAVYKYVVFSSDDVDWIKLVRFLVPFIVKFLVIGSCRSGNNTIVSGEPVTSSIVQVVKRSP